MALLHMEGFEDQLYTSRPNRAADGSWPSGGTGVGRFGGNCGNQLGDTQNRGMYFDFAATQTVVVGFGLHIVTASTNDVPLELYDGANRQLLLRWDLADQSLYISNDSATSTPIVQSNTGSVPEDTWVYVEIKALISNTVGTLEIRINGQTQDSGTSLDTRGAGGDQVTRVRFPGNGSAYPDVYRIDDVYVLNTSGSENNDFLGDVRVLSLYPNGNGNSSGMTGSDGNSTDNYLLVDEEGTPVTTDYVGGGTEGDKDTYTLDDLPSTNYDVLAVSVALWAAKSDAGAKFMRPVVRTASTDYVGTSVALATDYGLIEYEWVLNPNTSSAWTAAQVNSLEAGQEVRDS